MAGDRPPLGGWRPSVVFSEVQAAVLGAVADELIPGDDQFPAPSAVNVIAFIAKYTAPAGIEPKWYPYFGERDLTAWLDGLGTPFVETTSQSRVETLEALERDNSDFFVRLRDVVYYAYYSRPAVIRAINIHVAAGKDYRDTPQPFGYSDVIEDWDEALLRRVTGSYKRTQDVRPLALPATLATMPISGDVTR